MGTASGQTPRLDATGCAWLRHLLDALADPVLILDAEGLIIAFSSSARSELDLNDGNIGASLWSYRPDLVGTRFWTEFQDVAETGTSCEGGDLDIKSNRWLHYQLQPIHDPLRSVRWVAVSWKVATRERLLEASLTDLYSQIEFVLSIGRVVHYVSDIVTNRIHFSKNGFRKFGRTSMRRDEFLDQVHPDDRARAAGLRATAIERGGEPAEIDLRYRHPDGRLLTFRNRAVFEPGHPGRNDRISGIAILLKEEASLDREHEPLTGVQVRAARGMLGWSVNELAGRSRVSASTIIRTEAEPGPSKAKTSGLEALRHAFESAGVRFFIDGNGHPALSFQPREPTPPDDPSAA